MSLSFKDSLEKNNEINKPVVATESATVAAFNVDDMDVMSFDIMTLDENNGIAVYAGDDGNWIQHTDYVYYSTFSDDNISVINDKKEISLNDKQINITQEENSQFIPFEMPRYYDGYDLTKAALSVHYETRNGGHGSSKVINVTYNNEKIRFGWLVGADATVDAGMLKFEFHAYGTVRGNDGVVRGYTWKTRPNENLNVLQSLCDCEDVINNIDDSWMQELITDITKNIADEIKNIAVGDQVKAAEDAAESAQQSANTASQYAENASSAATTAVTNVLANYSTTEEMKEYVEQQIANADIEGKLTEYAKTNEVENLIGDIGNSTNVVTYVDAAIESVDVTEQLKEYTKTDDVKALIGDIGNSENVVAYVNTAIEGVDVTEQLKEYAKTDDIDSALLTVNNALQNNYYDKVSISEILEPYATKGNVSEQLGEYAKIDDVDSRVLGINVNLGNNYYTKTDIDEYYQMSERGGDTLIWDGDISGLETTKDGNYYKISNATPTYDEMKSIVGSRYMFDDGRIVSLTEYMGDGYFENNKYAYVELSYENVTSIYLYVYYQDNSEGVSPGIYAPRYDGHILFITIEGYEEFPQKTLRKKYIPTEEIFTEENVRSALGYAPVNPTDVYAKSETYSKYEVNEFIDNIDSAGYATETYVDNKVSPLSSSVNANAENISSLSTAVGELQADVNAIDKSPRLTYDVEYNDVENPDVGENVFVFYEIENEGKENEKKEAKKKFTIVGGSGGGATSSSLKIGYITTSPLVVAMGDKAIIKYTFSGTDSSGDAVPEGTATWKVAGRIVATNVALNGENEFDVTDYLSIGTQKVNLSIVDEAGSLVTKTWTVQKIDVRLESTFNDKLTYPMGKVSFDYTPYGAISKDVHFVLDGKEIGKITTSSSGIPMAYEIPAQTHGSHLLEAYITAEVNGNHIEPEHIYRDILWYDGVTSPVIGTVYQNFTARQYDATNIEYTVYDPSTETPTVEIAVDGVVVSTPTLDKSTNVYSFKTDVVGEHIITIKCGETVKTLKANIAKLDINIEPVTAGLAFDFNPSGKSNNDVDRVWSDENVSMTVSDNFDWVNGGYQYDENGDQYFCIKAGTSAEIDYQLFADDAKKNGKEFKLVFKTTNVAKPDATFLHCMDNTTDSDHIGIQMDVHEAFIYGQADKLHLPYSEEDIIEFEFNISKDTETVPMVMGYEDGVSTVPMVYDDSYNFTQNTPKTISLGSEDCDLHIYRFKVYNTSLTDRGILNNFITDARNAEEMVARYDRNQIYDENQNLDPDVLAEKCPWLRIIKIEAPHFTTGKKYPINNTTIEYIYKDGDPILDNWKATDCVHVGQGTSSDNYGAAGRNIDLVLKSHKDFNNSPVITLSDGTVVDKVSLTRNSIPVNYFNVKVNIASSENANNALLQRRYNEYNPYKRAFVRDSEDEIAKIKDTMEFYNCVVFIKETGDVSEHSEFADNEWHFYAIGNIGDSKKTDKTRLTDPKDRYECINEIVDVELPLSDFPSGEEAIAILEAEKFDKSGTYEWRYIWEDGTDEENAEVAEYCKQRWIEFYKFVVNSTDEEFKAHLGDYFVLDSALYYYLFTTRYTMVDNRAKNSFWHYGKCADGQYRWDLSFDYDNDTSLGINNYGDMVYRYGLEDKHVDENGVEIFRESDSTFFCRLRDLFKPELKAMYNTLEGQGAWSSDSLITQFDEWQSQFPEELWRTDIVRKYIRTFTSSHIDGKAWEDALRDMAHGRKKYQRREFERGQEQYMASAYQSGLAASDENSIVIRCAKVAGDNLVVKPNYSLTLTPYAYMYLNVEYSTKILQEEVTELGKPITLTFDGDSTDIVKIYSAASIQSLGDLSPCYARTIDAGAATKLKELIIGNSTVGYDNPHLSSLTTGANYLLEKLNIENVSGLTTPLNLAAMNNLKELYAHGSNIGGVTFADGGKIEIAELPAINALTMKNLRYFTNLDIADFSKLTTLTVENCSTVDLLNILDKANNINRIRITGIDWSLENTSLLNRLYAMKGIDKNGYNADQSVLSGTVHVPTIEQKEYNDFKDAWSDLEITYNTMVLQHPVTFVNYDGTILEVQYVNEGEYAIDPVTRQDNPIPTPTKESTVSTDYTFAGWDRKDLGSHQIFGALTVTATYRESTREYTIRYVSKSASGTIIKQESVGKYGENIPYDYEANGIPTYTYEEGAYNYYLFNRWDKSGIIDGDKTVTAIFDSFKYTGTNSFAGKDIGNLKPVELYALTKLTESGKTLADFGMSIEVADPFSFTMGYDVDFDDIESVEVISEKTSFSGTNYLDTGIKLFNEDRDFVLVLDYTISEDNTEVGTFTQCFQTSGSNGFKLGYSGSAPEFVWGSATPIKPSSVGNREMLVVRHKKGDNNLYVYVSNLDSTEPTSYTIERNAITQSDNATLIFGAAKMDSGRITGYCMGDIHWCKIWYQDLGEKACEQLVGWTHEEITLGVSGFYRYPLYDDRSKETMVSLVASHLLDRKMKYNTNNTNAGGWAESNLNKVLNSRFYNAIPVQIRLMLKKMCVLSTIGQMSTEVSESGCYVNIPSVYDVDSNETAYKNELYSGASTITTMATNKQRIREYRHGYNNDNVDAYDSYWLRSPNTYNSSYVWSVNENYANHNSDSMGSTSGFNTANTLHGVIIEISF